MIKLALVSDALSPFWVDVALAAAKIGIDFKVLFKCSAIKSGRPAYWQQWRNSEEELKQVSRTAPDGFSPRALTNWFTAELNRLKPQIVISASYLPWAKTPSRAYALRHNVPLGLWAERPHPGSGLRNRAKRLIIKHLCKDFRFCYAIGHGAVEDYSMLLPKSAKIFLVPYGINLKSFEPESSHIVKQYRHPLRALFAGQLIARNNIEIIVEAIKILNNKMGPNSPHFMFSGEGPEKRKIEQLLIQRPELAQRVALYPNNFETFEERALPYKLADFFIYPSSYSGWGLVIPEAMAAGLPVVSTREVEAAKYLLEDNKNGLFIEPTAASLASAIQTLCESRDQLPSMGIAAREGAKAGSADTVAEKLRVSLQSMKILN